MGNYFSHHWWNLQTHELKRIFILVIIREKNAEQLGGNTTTSGPLY